MFIASSASYRSFSRDGSSGYVVFEALCPCGFSFAGISTLVLLKLCPTNIPVLAETRNQKEEAKTGSP